jgi:hypothetical protein
MSATLSGADALVIAVGFVPGNPFKMYAAAIHHARTHAHALRRQWTRVFMERLASAQGLSGARCGQCGHDRARGCGQGSGGAQGRARLIDPHRRPCVGAEGQPGIRGDQRVRPRARGEARRRKVHFPRLTLLACGSHSLPTAHTLHAFPLLAVLSAH